MEPKQTKEESEQQFIEAKSKKLNKFIKENSWFLLVFFAIVIIRFYYFLVTNGQPLWWDEAEYMSAAKSYAGITNYELSGLRLPGFSLLMSLFFISGLTSETIMRFFGLLIPSLLVILLTYFIVKEMYQDKKAAII